MNGGVPLKSSSYGSLGATLGNDTIPGTAVSLTIDADGVLRGIDRLHHQVLFMGG